jgi:hypothetical protein
MIKRVELVEELCAEVQPLCGAFECCFICSCGTRYHLCFTVLYFRESLPSSGLFFDVSIPS